MNRSDSDQTKRFAAFVCDAARAAGYDIDAPRGGDRTRLAHDTGMSVSTTSRMLLGRCLPDPYQLQPLARALRVQFGELLVLHGVADVNPFPDEVIPPKPLETPEEYAAELGISTPLGVAMFKAVVETILAQESASS